MLSSPQWKHEGIYGICKQAWSCTAERDASGVLLSDMVHHHQRNKRSRAGVLCGAAASGNFTWTPEHVAQSLVCMTMSGPFLTGYTQTINDYYDREIDAINEPDRPIPSGETYD